MSTALERNLKLIRWHQALLAANPWIAVFVLFVRDEFGLDEALLLAGIYYASVALLEVPSGWMSDRVGRVLTLRISSAAFVGTFTCYLLGADRFWLIVVGQLLLAVAYSFLSGTDVSFHYESLEGLGRADEYADRQASVSSTSLIVAAAAALLGGALGLIDLRLAFLASVLISLAQLGVAMGFTEPTHNAQSTSSFASQVTTCLRYLRNAPLAWVFGYGIALVVLEHVAHQLFQPWLTSVLGRDVGDLGATPLVAGSVLAVVALVGSAFARTAPWLSRRFGLRPALVGLGVLSAIIVTAMAASTAPVVILLVIMRSAQGAAAPILISAAVAPHVEAQHRATFLSLDSLSGRLTYSGLLLVIASDIDEDLPRALTQLSIASWITVALVAVGAILVWRRHGAAAIA